MAFSFCTKTFNFGHNHYSSWQSLKKKLPEILFPFLKFCTLKETMVFKAYWILSASLALCILNGVGNFGVGGFLT